MTFKLAVVEIYCDLDMADRNMQKIDRDLNSVFCNMCKMNCDLFESTN